MGAYPESIPSIFAPKKAPKLLRQELPWCTKYG